MSLLDKVSLCVTPNSYKTSKLYSVIPNTTLGDMDVVRATTATRVNASSLIESVGLNIPRIDYTNGSCPSLLVEPQRTNLLTYSNDFTNGWTGAGITGTANYGVAPDGTNTSTRLVFSGANQIWLKSISNLIGNNGVFSLYIKGVVGQTILITYAGTTDKTITLLNGWNRYNVNGLGVSNNIFINTFGGATARDIEVWGGQVELGSYATSYIPTVASTVTRNADVISKTGISSLIGQTEGTIFLDMNLSLPTDTKSTFFSLIGNSSWLNNSFYFDKLNNNKISFSSAKSSAGNGVITSTNAFTNQRVKIALRYSGLSIKMYINGNLEASGSLTNQLAVIDRVYLNELGTLSQTSNYQKNNYNSICIFKTALTETECINLTTI